MDALIALPPAGVRDVHLAWESSLSNHSMGARRLPELREKLFKVR